LNVKVRRYIAPDIRTALNQVREAQGPDAVILSQRKVEGGIEIITADGHDEALLTGHWNNKPKEPSPPVNPSTETKKTVSTAPARFETETEQRRQETRVPPKAPQPARPTFERKLEEAYGQGPARHSATGPQLIWTQEPLLEQMRGELKSLRQLLEQQMASLAWGDVGRRHPLQASLLRKLVRLGLTASLARVTANEIPDSLDDETAWRRALGLFCQRLPIAKEPILTHGGVVALVGPTGVGKTTLIEKLAVRFSLTHGRDSVALITVDNRRIGAFEQLRTFGGLAGLPVWTVGSGQDLSEVLETVYDKRLVLIDTAGMGYRDPRLGAQLEAIKGCSPRLRSYVVVSASTESQGLDQIITTYQPIEPAGCMITKLDEATSLGAALAAATEHNLPVAYTSSGQRIPDDLDEAQGPQLVSRAVTLMRQRRKEEDDLFMETMFEGASAYAAG
jgi:flagellar biosynthesis protein FlhF